MRQSELTTIMMTLRETPVLSIRTEMLLIPLLYTDKALDLLKFAQPKWKLYTSPTSSGKE
jgi:hypothetical protein